MAHNTPTLQFQAKGPAEGIALQHLAHRADQPGELMTRPEQADGDAEPAHGHGLAMVAASVLALL